MGKRKSTKYPGVQARESEDRRYRGRPDVCYTIDYRDATGKRIRKDIGWASQGFSAGLAAEMRAKLINAEKSLAVMGTTGFQRKESVLTFTQAWEKYKRDWLIANGKDTKSSQSIINQHLQELLDIRLNEITPYTIDQLMAKMRRHGLSPQTIRHAVALMRRVMRRMVIWKIYSGPLPFAEITLPKLNNARERFLTPSEARDLLAELEKHSRQTWLMALVSLHCGLRFGEIARLRWENIDTEGMSIFIAESKSGRARHAVMTPDVAKAFSAMRIGNRHDLVFPSRNGGVMKGVSEVFFRAVDAVGLNDTGETITHTNGAVERVKIKDRRQRVVFHTLRHTYASWLAKGGQGQLAIADRLGHHSLEMTKRYTHLMDETRKASAEAISRMFHDQPPENQ